MKPILCGLLVLHFVFACVAASALEPANPNANAKAKAILNYLHNLPVPFPASLATRIPWWTPSF